MKRYRLYTQQGAHLSKIYGKHRTIKTSVMPQFIDFPRCGFDKLIDAERYAALHKVHCWPEQQLVIIDFIDKGKIIKIL